MLHPHEMPVSYVSRPVYLSRIEYTTKNPHLWEQVDDFAVGCPAYHGIENCSGEFAVLIPAHEAICIASVENPDGYMLRPKDAAPMPDLVWVNDDGEEEEARWIDLRADREQTRNEHRFVDDPDTDSENEAYWREYRYEVSPNWATW